MAAGAAGQIGGKVDCFGVLIRTSELERNNAAWYWGGGVYGVPGGSLCDEVKALSRFIRLRVTELAAQCMAADFTNRVPAVDRNAETFKAYANWQRKRSPDYFERASLVRIVARCPQMMHQAETGGAAAGYATWLAVLSILQYSDGGEDEATIEELTGRHADYDPRTAVHKMSTLSAPHRCNTFDENLGGICHDCRFAGIVNSPIALGFEREPKVRAAQ